MSIEKVVGVIKKYDKFLITSHKGPEGDSIGSQLAMAGLLRQLKKKFIIVNQDPAPRIYRFLPQVDAVSTGFSAKFPFQAALVLDCPSLHRTGKVLGLVEKAGKIVNIDHHISNKAFGHINWVEPNSSSTGEMIYLLYRKLGFAIKTDTALFLYVAILTDTGSFRYANTTARTHNIVAHLLESGVKPKQISERIYEANTFASRKLLSLSLATLKRADQGKIAWMRITPQMLKRAGARIEDAEDFVNFARFIEGVKVAMLFSPARKKGAVKVSFRSNEDVNVNTIASRFGGGGHKTAGGCVLEGSVAAAQRLILAEVRKALFAV